MTVSLLSVLNRFMKRHLCVTLSSNEMHDKGKKDKVTLKIFISPESIICLLNQSANLLLFAVQAEIH